MRKKIRTTGGRPTRCQRSWYTHFHYWVFNHLYRPGPGQKQTTTKKYPPMGTTRQGLGVWMHSPGKHDYSQWPMPPQLLASGHAERRNTQVAPSIEGHHGKVQKHGWHGPGKRNYSWRPMSPRLLAFGHAGHRNPQVQGTPWN